MKDNLIFTNVKATVYRGTSIDEVTVMYDHLENLRQRNLSLHIRSKDIVMTVERVVLHGFKNTESDIFEYVIKVKGEII